MPIDPSSAIPQKQFVQNGDINPTDVRDKGLGQILGLDNYRGNALQQCLGFGKNVHNLVDRLTKPFQSLVKLAMDPVGSLIKHIFNLAEASARKELSPPFKDARELLNTGEGLVKLQTLARESEICGGGLAGTGVHLGVDLPEDPGPLLSKEEYIQDMKSKSPDGKLLFSDESVAQYYKDYAKDHVKKTEAFDQFVKKDPGDPLSFEEYVKDVRSKCPDPSAMPKEEQLSAMYKHYKGGHAKKAQDFTDFIQQQDSYKMAKSISDNLPLKLKSNIKSHDGMFIDKNTGLAMMFAVDAFPGERGKPTIHLQFLGTGSGTDQEGPWVGAEHFSTDLAMSGLTYGMPPNFKQGSEIAALFKEKFGEDFNIECKGHSMGGALATYIGIKNDLRVTTTHTAPLSPQLQKDLGVEAMHKAVTKDRITHLSVKGDWLTDNSRFSRGMAKGFEYLTGKNTSHIIGSGYRINEESAGYQYKGKGIHVVLNVMGLGKLGGIGKKSDQTMKIHNHAHDIWNKFAERSMKEIPELSPDHSSIF